MIRTIKQWTNGVPNEIQQMIATCATTVLPGTCYVMPFCHPLPRDDAQLGPQVGTPHSPMSHARDHGSFLKRLF